MQKCFGRNGELTGILLTERQAGGFTVGDWRSPASAPAVQPHGHDTAHFVVVTAGQFHSEACGTGGPTEVIFNPAGTYHADHFEGGGAFIGITLDHEASASLAPLQLPTSPVRFATPAAAGVAGRLMRAAHADSPFEGDEVGDLCAALVGEIPGTSDESMSKPKWLSRAAEFLRDDADGYDVNAAARSVGVHPVHLTRCFRQHFGCTPGEYQRQHRVQRAAYLLARSRRPVSFIAAECNFADQSHLVRSFRRYFGTTPHRFRLGLA